MRGGLERLRVSLAEAPWLLRCAWTVALLEFALVTVNAHRGGGLDLYWLHLGTDAFFSGDEPYRFDLMVNPPSAMLLLPWAGIHDFEAVRTVFLALDAPAVGAGALVCVSLVGRRPAGLAAAALVLLLAVTPAVRLTLALANVNGLIFLGQAVAFAAMVRGRWTLAGVALGLGFALKPILVPLLVIPLALRRWGCVAAAVAVPTVLSLIAIAINHDAFGFVTEAVPFLLGGNHPRLVQHNVSLLGTADHLGLPAAVGELVRAVVLVACVVLAWLRWHTAEAESPERERRDGVEPLRLLEASGFLILGTIMCFSFGWVYYAIYLVPLLVTVLDERSLLRNVPAFAGLFLMCSPTTLVSDEFERAATRFEQSRPALAWLLILTGMGLALLRRRRGSAGARGADEQRAERTERSEPEGQHQRAVERN